MKFRLRRGKPVRRVIRKLFAFHVERCRSLLAADESQVGRIHEVRKSIKRLRALVSLVGQGLGSERRWFDRHLRDVNRLLSPVRDAESLREAFDRIAVADESPPDEFAVIRAVLWSWSDQHERPSDVAVERACRELSRIERRWKKARLKSRGWSLLEDNVRRTYRRCRRTVCKLPVQATAAELHELRKLVKQTQYHWEFLQPLWPVRLQVELAELETLSDNLGAHHDAQMLREWLDQQAKFGLTGQAAQLLVQMLDRQQHQLEEAVRRTAPLVFAEPPRGISKRLKGYWRSWRRPTDEPASSERRPSQPTLLQSVAP